MNQMETNTSTYKLKPKSARMLFSRPLAGLKLKPIEITIDEPTTHQNQPNIKMIPTRKAKSDSTELF